jgi:DNA-directed RNA polymerase subunit beta
MPTDPSIYRDFLDVPTTRRAIFDNVQEALTKRFPIGNDRFSLELSDIRYDKPRDFTLAEQKKAIMESRTLDWPIKGSWTFRDKTTGDVLGKSDKVVARVPYMTGRGTFILNGNEYSLTNQQRLRPGMYARRKESGELEMHAALIPGTGRSFRIFLEPDSGVFKFMVGQGTVTAYPVLKALGVSDEDMQSSWGEQLWRVNQAKARDVDLKKAAEKFANRKDLEEGNDPGMALRAAFGRMALDPEISTRTLGGPYDRVDRAALLAATRKLHHINLGKADPDDRDSQANQHIMGPEDIIAERLAKDAGGLQRNLLWKISHRGDVSKIPSSALTKQVLSAFMASGLGAPMQQINPLESMDQLARVSRLGEGGIPSSESIPDEARSVSPSQMGLIDPVRGPESGNLGVDTRVAIGVFKGKDGLLYRSVTDARTGKPVVVSSRDMTSHSLSFPNEMAGPGKLVRAMVNGNISYIPREKVDYVIPSGADMFSHSSNLIPGLSGVKAGRLLMAGKMVLQAVPLHGAEAPLVRAATPDGLSSFDDQFGTFAGAVRAETPGIVESVDPDGIVLRDDKGNRRTIDLYNNFPFNQKTSFHNTPLVKAGDKVKPGQLLAKSNYTDDKGAVALGRNLRLGYLVHPGNYEDGIVVSESAAKKLTSEHMYQRRMDLEDLNLAVDRNRFLSTFPSKFDKRQMSAIGDDGVVKPGTVVHDGDPLVLGVKEMQPVQGAALLRGKRSIYSDHSLTWDHEDPGVVTDVFRNADGLKVAVKSYAPAKVGDKMAGRGGNKGVISEIVPDDQMPKAADGQPLEVLMNPLGLISRVNPSIVLAEVALAKVARKTGQPYNLKAMDGQDILELAQSELRKHGLSDTEDVWDPRTNRKLKEVMVGELYMMKLHHMAEGKDHARDTGSYTADEQPAKGGHSGAKRLGGLEMYSVLAHNAPAVIKDAKMIRGQKNDEFWRAFRMGLPTPSPKSPMVYGKFLAQLQAAGVNVKRTPEATNFMAMTDADVDSLAGDRELTSGDAVSMKDHKPVEGGLFDMGLTGGVGGNRWARITLTEPLPSPVMEEPIRHLLGLTKKGFEGMLSAPGGPGQMLQKLQAIDVDSGIEQARDEYKSAPASRKDEALKRWRALESAKATGIHPARWMVNKVPVLPPSFRPVTLFRGMEMTSDFNLLYKELFEANKNLKELKAQGLDGEDDRLTLYNSFKGLVGTGDPVGAKLQQKSVGGLLTHIFGKSSPKFGAYQRRLTSFTVDTVGRGVLSSDNTLGLDQVGVPEDMAWTVYRPFVMRELARRFAAGPTPVPLVELARWVQNKDPRARRVLDEVVTQRPVLYTRAPALHKFSIAAGWPVLTKGNTLRMPSVLTAGFGADFDGDQINIHVPVSDDAVKQSIEKMLPSKTLFAPSSFDVHYLPRQEYLMGLYLATRKPPEKAPKTFADRKAAVAAMFRGEVGMSDPVRIES